MSAYQKIGQNMESLSEGYGAPGIRISRMMLVSTAVIMTSTLPHKVVASLPFQVFQLAHPFVKRGFGYRFPDENHTLFFVEAYFFTRRDIISRPTLRLLFVHHFAPGKYFRKKGEARCSLQLLITVTDKLDRLLQLKNGFTQQFLTSQ
jgi:hypothetical protein